LVSVLVPVYNQEAILPSTLDSILSQTYENYEICISDDRSSDASPQILSDYAARHPGKFRLLLQERNLGVTDNSNALLKICTGKYIAFLAGDDLMYPEKLETQVALMESDENCRMCYHDVDVITFPEGEKTRVIAERTPPREGGVDLLLREGCFFATQSLLARRDCIPAAGYNSIIAYASDWLMFTECLESGGVIRHAPGVLGAYRRHGNNLTDGTNLFKMAKCYFDTALGLGIMIDRHSGRAERTADLAALGKIWLQSHLLAIEAYLKRFEGVQPLDAEAPSLSQGPDPLIEELERTKARNVRLREELDTAKETVERLRRKLENGATPKASWLSKLGAWRSRGRK
jgi:glycosyltransferase involved in cell wall biosynthesis